MALQQATKEQAMALVLYAHDHGARWKSDLRKAWETGQYIDIHGFDLAVLQGIRNNLGPSWLYRTRLSDLQMIASEVK